MIQDKRLDKVEQSLTARQAVVLWLDEIRQFQSVFEYVRFLRTQPESAAPVTRLTGQIDHAVRQAMKGRPKEVIEPAVRRAVRDVVFLIKLHHQANGKVYTEQRPWNLTLAFLAEMIHGILTEHLWQRALKKQKGPPRSKRVRRIERLQHWREISETLLIDVYGLRGAVACIKTHYFDGHELLFADADQTLADIIDTTSQFVGMFNDLCYEERQRRLAIDLEEVQKSALDKTARDTTYLVDMAKSDALDMLGDREAGIRIADRYL